MKLEILSKENEKARIKATFEKEEVAMEFASSLREISKRITVPGFRKGKVPKGLVLSRVSQEALEEEVRDNLRERAVRESLSTLELELRKRAVDFFDTKLPTENSSFECVFDLPIIPKVVLPDLSSIKIPLKRIIVSREMKEEYKNRLQERFAKYVEKKTKLNMGDAVVYDLKTYFSDNKVEAPLAQDGVFYITGQEDNLPGYDENLIGAEAGQSIKFQYTMPEDFFLEKVAGKKLTFDIKIKSVQERIVPEFNLEFVRSHFKMEDMREFDSYLEETLLAEVEREEERYKESQVLEQVAQRMDVQISEELIKEEVDYLVASQDRKLRQRKSSLEEMLSKENKTLLSYREELKPLAILRIRKQLLIREVAKQEKIIVQKEELSRYIAFLAQRYGLNKAQISKLLKNEEFIEDISSDIMQEKVANFLAKRVSFFYEDEQNAN